jgi:GT2 family glycosyltransferase
MARIALATPCYGARDPDIERNLRTAIMATSKEHDWKGDISTIRQGWVPGRNASAKAAVEAGDVDYICWMDDDVLMPIQTFNRLLRSQEDFVTGILYQKYIPHYPLISRWDKEREGFAPFESWPENVLLPIDGCGFGVCVTSTKLLRKIQALPGFEKDGWFNQISNIRGGLFGEDFSFCLRAKQAGVQLWCDTAVVADHQIGPMYATVEHFKSAAPIRAEREKTHGNLQG